MAQQENTPGGMHVVDADLAAEALQSVDTVRERARLTAGLTPAWYGPAAAVALIVPALVDAWAQGRGGWAVLLSLLIAFAGLAVLVVLVNVARRRSGVMVTLPWSARLRRTGAPLLALLAAGGATYGLCRQFGADQAVSKIALFAVLGLGVWAVFAARNATIKQKLRATG
ncbi:hypothetical protein OG978_22685 [Streptomyces sp. NBC_01591]|uniref:hypothetical protein n=1 Tax=Streptomyces sp. NBC_01591 TaxID=2975888 RepID=UPI002DDBEFBA|nr:hypothetical protein [Streptomyces sp. NBC_01591]WSD69932.1 hypothetical protein OG978_22685 [Streptomyces sp. NBC_01591]